MGLRAVGFLFVLPLASGAMTNLAKAQSGERGENRLTYAVVPPEMSTVRSLSGAKQTDASDA